MCGCLCLCLALVTSGCMCSSSILADGFRKAENIEDSLNSELYFYSKVFGFECAGDEIVPFAIDNLP